MRPKIKQFVVTDLLINMIIGSISWADQRRSQTEKRIIEYITSNKFSAFHPDRRCPPENNYRVYLTDNFGIDFKIVPEVKTSHGEIMLKLLRSGRNDIDVKVLDTTLSKGLAQVIGELIDGACIDAVISSIPGSIIPTIR